jgi:hypothetical protein
MKVILIIMKVRKNFIKDEDYDIEFTESEVRNAVFAQNNSKSLGMDYLIAEIFKTSFELISPFFIKTLQLDIPTRIFSRKLD